MFLQALALDAKSDLSTEHWQRFARRNLLYLGSATPVLQQSFHRSQALFMVCDEAQFNNCQILAPFLGSLLASDVAFGLEAPLQVMPDLHLDLETRSIDARVELAMRGATSGKRLDRAMAAAGAA